MNERSRQLSTKVKFKDENLFVSEFKFAIFFRNQSIIYDFIDSNTYCMIPFSFVSNLTLENKFLFINFKTYPYFFEYNSKIKNYSALNSFIDVKKIR